MHEVGIAQSLIELAADQVRHLGPLVVSRVGIRLGELSGVAPESLSFCFNCLKENTLLSATELVIEWRSRYGCSCITSPSLFTSSCPECGSAMNHSEAESLQLLYVEWEEVSR